MHNAPAARYMRYQRAVRSLWRMRPPLRSARAPLLGLSDNPAFQWWRDASIMQPDSWWGHAPGDAALQQQVALMRELGIGWFRMEAPWRAIAPNRPGGPRAYDAAAARDPAWSGYRWQMLDRALELLTAAGIRLLPVVVFAPAWAAREAQRSAPTALPRQDYWCDFLSAFATRYAGRLSAVELWNEPDHPHSWAGTLEEYVRLVLRPGADAVRAAAPGCRVVNGGVADARQMETLCCYARPTDFDIASVHVYPAHPWAGEVRAAVRTTRAALHARGFQRHPVWVTEWGVATQAPSTPSGFGTWTSEQAQAHLIARVHATSGADALFYYQLCDSRILDAQHRVLKEVYWGLVTRDRARRKPGFAAFSATRSKTSAAQLP